ncbi:ffcf578c-0c12-408a-9e33-349b72476228 [Sclerotinia trifoliorum]|uniref:Ffcf578c-0c12-408a-9e33-349b72476228 n=1 Tax=Sclerotinia trifoliorum TaxID=28548 RepID=A0A8H2W271_9HELO|nr:ffcf578c-0c12-408a-9e33-349b72476228 [Sclerotinia trifoliorum]
MHFSNSFLIAGLIAFASASPAPAPAPEPTTPTAAQTSAVVNDLESYFAALATQPAMLSVVSSLATDTAALNSLQAFQESLQADVLNGETPNTSALAALPSPLANVILSAYTVEMSIFSKDGFGDLVASATASEAATASDTGAAKTATATQKSSASGSGTASASSTDPATVEKGAAGALGVDMLSICGGLAVGVVGAIMAL